MMENTKVLSGKPHFFKPLVPGFHQECLIPVAFLKHLNGKNHVKAVLRSPKGKAWPVKINGRRIENGWEEFVMEHDLHVGDFLVLGHAGHMVFDVMVFDSSGCEREYPNFNVKEEKESSEDEEPEKKVGSREFTRNKHTVPSSEREVTLAIKNPYFEATVKPYHIKEKRMLIPMRFARSNGLNNRVCKITLMNQKGRSWSANLKHQNSNSHVYIVGGWNEFRIQHNLKKGNSFILELIDNGTNPKFVFHRI